jgi:hypothetical protein
MEPEVSQCSQEAATELQPTAVEHAPQLHVRLL